MKSIMRLLIFALSMWSHCPALTKLQPDGRAPEELRFVFTGDSDAYRMSEDERSQLKEQILVTPDFSNRIYELLWEYVDLRASGEIGTALSALGVKADLKPDKLKRITDRLWELANHGFEGLDLADQNFLNGGVIMLGGFPSPENEDLALKIYETGEWWLQESAVVTLGKIGTKKSLEHVRQFVVEEAKRAEFAQKERTEEYGPNGDVALRKPAGLVALERLERRIKSGGRTGAGDFASSSASDDGLTRFRSSNYLRQNSTFIGLLAAGVALLTFLILFLRKSGVGK